MANNKSNSFENALMLLIFNNDASGFDNLGDAAGLLPSAADGSLYVALHTADPGEAGNQSTNEISYTGYARVAVARTSGEWTVVGNNVTNANAVTFGQCTAGSGTVTHVSVGKELSGATDMIYSAQLQGGATLPVAVGITPNIAVGIISITEE